MPKPLSLVMSKHFLTCPGWRTQHSADSAALRERRDPLCQACPAAVAHSLAAGGRAALEPVPCLPGGLWRCLLACQDVLSRCEQPPRAAAITGCADQGAVLGGERRACSPGSACRHGAGRVIWGSSPPSCLVSEGHAAVVRFAQGWDVQGGQGQGMQGAFAKLL